MRRPSVRLALVCMSLCSCVPQFPEPMTPQQLAQYDSGAALVAYLGQGEADSAVCNLRGQTPHLSKLTHAVAGALVDGLVSGSVWMGRFRSCAAALLASAPAPQARELLDAMGEGYRSLIKRSDFETAQDTQARLEVLQQLYLERSHEQQGDPGVVDGLFAELRAALDQGQLGPLAARFGKALLAAYDLEHDRWQDGAVDSDVIDRLAAVNDESTLRLFEARLHADDLRLYARRQIARLHIAASTRPEVVAQPDAVEAKLMELGRNPVDLAVHALEHAQLAEPMPWQSVYVHQDLREHTLQLKARLADSPRWESELPLRGRLLLKVHALRDAITLCAPPEALDPEPCVLPSEVTTDTPLAGVAGDGVLHLADRLPLSEAVALLHVHPTLHVPLQIRGKPALTLDWPLHFQRPASLMMMGQTPGTNGPAIELSVECPQPGLYTYSLQTPELRGELVVEEADLDQFFVVSQGAPGADGEDGAPGSRGQDAGECGNGRHGGDGGPGKDGGPGADGGDVRVHVHCGPGARLQAILQKTVRSAAGSGGRAGRGGPGGRGGAGGTGRDSSVSHDSNGHETKHSSCASGMRGRDGESGPDGQPGIPGSAGHVFFVAE